MILLIKIGYSSYIIPEKHRDAAISVLGSLQPVKQGGGYNSPVYEDLNKEADIEIKFIPECCYKKTTGNPEMFDKILKLEEERKQAENKRYEAIREKNAIEQKVQELETLLAALPAPQAEEVEEEVQQEAEYL